MCPKLYRLMRRARAHTPTLGITTSPQVVSGIDVCRLRVWMSTNQAQTYYIAFSNSQPTVEQLCVNPAGSPLCIKVEDIGDRLFLPIWIWSSSANITYTGLTIVSGIPQDIAEYAGDY